MQKVVKVDRVEVVKAGKTDRIVLYYTSVDGKSYTPGVPDRIGALAVKLDDDSRKAVLAAKSGDMLDIEMIKEDKYWNLTKASSSNGTAINSSRSVPAAAQVKKPFDDVGIKVGASRNQALAFLAATKGSKFTLDDVDAISYEIVIRQAKQEDNIRNNANPASSVSTPSEVGCFDDVDDEFFK